MSRVRPLSVDITSEQPFQPPANDELATRLILCFLTVFVIFLVALILFTLLVPSDPIFVISSASITPLSTINTSTWELTLKSDNDDNPIYLISYKNITLSVFYNHNSSYTFLSETHLDPYTQNIFKSKTLNPRFDINMGNVDMGVVARVLDEQEKGKAAFQLRGSYSLSFNHGKWGPGGFNCTLEIKFNACSSRPTTGCHGLGSISGLPIYCCYEDFY